MLVVIIDVIIKVLHSKILIWWRHVEDEGCSSNEVIASVLGWHDANVNVIVADDDVVE